MAQSTPCCPARAAGSALWGQPLLRVHLHSCKPAGHLPRRRASRQPAVHNQQAAGTEIADRPAEAPAHGLLASRRSALGALGAALLLPWLPGTQERAAQAALGNGGTVFVAGATGATGKRAVAALLARGYRVRAGVRDVDKARSKVDWADQAGVELVAADVTQPPKVLQAAIGNAEAVVCAIGAGGSGGFFSAFDSKTYDAIDRQGTVNLVDAAKKARVGRFVLLSSLLTNGAANGQSLNPAFLVLNTFGKVLDKKLEAEKYLRSSGLEWSIVRPGGLSNKPASEVGNLVVRGEDTLFGRKGDPGTSISRDTVAEVLAEAVSQAGAANRVLEIVASPSAPTLPPNKWFA